MFLRLRPLGPRSETQNSELHFTVLQNVEVQCSGTNGHKSVLSDLLNGLQSDVKTDFPLHYDCRYHNHGKICC